MKMIDLGEELRLKTASLALTLFVLTLTLSSFASAQSISTPSYQFDRFSYYGAQEGVPVSQYYFPTVDPKSCEQGQGQDFLLNILPGSCSPAVVRSDLLEEQPVPVFCRLTGTKINPLIDVPQIKSINVASSEGRIARGIRAVLFHPYRAAIRASPGFTDLIGTPINNDLGYVVVVLDRIPVERDMPDSISANLTARITYDVTTSFGITNDDLLLTPLTDEVWIRDYKQYSFWQGKGYVRVLDVQEKSARVGVYSEPGRAISSFVVEEGKRSPLIYMPGTYCGEGLQVELKDVITPKNKATLNIDGKRADVVEGSKILDGKCTVREVVPSAYGLGGTVKIVCPDGTHSIERPGASIKFKIDGDVKKAEGYKAGDLISGVKTETSKNFVTFAGRYSLRMPTGDQHISILVVKELKDVNYKTINDDNRKIASLLSQKFYSSEGELKQAIEVAARGSTVIIGNNAEGKKIGGSDISALEVEGIRQISHPDLVERYYRLYRENVDVIVNDYPNEKLVDIEKGQPYGEVALLRAAETAQKIGKDQDAIKIYEELLNKYPETKSVEDVKRRLSTMYSTGSSEAASKVITSGGKSFYLLLDSVSRPSESELSADLFVNGLPQTKGLSELVSADSDWEVSDIGETAVKFKRLTIVNNIQEIKTASAGQTVRLDSKTEVKIQRINLQKAAVVSIHPFNKEGVTFANFSVNIGIEKRAVKLSVSQTKDLINKLDGTIKQFEEVKNKLGEVVENWKKVCLAGSAALWTFNFFENLASKGETIMRQFVMREANIDGYKGWAEWCSDKNNWKPEKLSRLGIQGEVDSFDECVFKSSGQIDKSIKLGEGIVNDWNKQLDAVKNASPKKGCIFGLFCKSQLDTDREKLVGEIQNKIFNKESFNPGSIAGIKDNKEVQFNSQQVGNILSNFSSLHQRGLVSFDESRDLHFEVEMWKKCRTGSQQDLPGQGFCDGIKQQLFQRLDRYDDLIQVRTEAESTSDQINSLLGISVNLPYITSAQTADAPVIQYGSLDAKNKAAFEGLSLKDSDNLAFIRTSLERQTFTGTPVRAVGTFALVVNRIEGSYYGPDSEKIYVLEGNRFLNKVTSEQKSLLIGTVGRISARRSCSNQYSNPTVQFWGSGPFTGLPAIMPLGRAPDGSVGWYAATKPYGDSLRAGLTNVQAYAESGEPTHFYIANVGPNGRSDFASSPAGDDECAQYFALEETYQGQTKLGQLSVEQTRAFVAKSVQCLKEASQKAKTPRGGKIGTQCGTFDVGEPKAAAPATQCTDFMSPGECTFLYNICDPVICPPSRCNFGGKFQTDNVVQTGIIGSLALCAPNFGNPLTDGGVAVPVCLTGVHAGLENLITVFKSVRGCLQTSLDTGRHVGICDQLQSLYLCEFFWRELTPFIRTGVPQLVERTVYGRSGGGEYLTFADAYEKSIQQVGFLTNYYGANALRAFQVRGTEEAGSLICKAFIGLRYPNAANLFDELARPESPPQINAWFDDFPFSSATVPPTSQYKVFFHIFAGSDEPAYWQVYLKDPPFSPGVSLPQNYIIQTGYAPKGEFATETRDFTAPSGYKQLCVRVNLKEYCGFKKVTTGFATEELTNLYVQSQTVPEYEITNENECTSGKASLLTSETLIPAITSPGFGGLTESLQPQIYRRGIVRICSQDNPGKEAEPERWDTVGFCDGSARKIRCWVDRRSVANAISDLGLRNATLEASRAASNNLLEGFEDYKSEEQSITELKNIKEGRQIEEIFKEINNAGRDLSTTEQRNAAESRLRNILEQGNTGATVKNLISLTKFSLSRRHRAEAQLQLAKIYEQITLHFAGPLPSKPSAETTAAASQVAVREVAQEALATAEFPFPRDKANLGLLSPVKADIEKAFRNIDDKIQADNSLKGKVLTVAGHYADGENPALSKERAEKTYDFLEENFEKSLNLYNLGLSWKDGGSAGPNGNKAVLEVVDCKASSALATKFLVFEGETIGLSAAGEGSCDRLRMEFRIMDPGRIIKRVPSNFAGSTVTAQWTAEKEGRYTAEAAIVLSPNTAQTNTIVVRKVINFEYALQEQSTTAQLAQAFGVTKAFFESQNSGRFNRATGVIEKGTMIRISLNAKQFNGIQDPDIKNNMKRVEQFTIEIPELKR